MRIFTSAIVFIGLSATSFADSSVGMPDMTTIDVDLAAANASISVELDMSSREGWSFDTDVWIDHLRSDGYAESFSTSTQCEIEVSTRTVDCDGVVAGEFTLSSRTRSTITLDLRPETVVAYRAGTLPTLLDLLVAEDAGEADEGGSSGDMTGQECSPPGSTSGPVEEVGCASAGGGQQQCCNLTCTYTCSTYGPPSAPSDLWDGRECPVPAAEDCWLEPETGGLPGGDGEVLGDTTF